MDANIVLICILIDKQKEMVSPSLPSKQEELQNTEEK